MRRGAVILALIFSFVLPASIEAGPLTNHSVRELVLHAETIVLAAPLGQPRAPTRFKVLEVLRGSGLKAGDTLPLDDLGWHDFSVWEEEPPHLKPNKLRIEKVLLFLGPNRGSRERPRFRPINSGLRSLTEDGSVLVPRPNHTFPPRPPFGYVMDVQRNIQWAKLVRQVRTDVEVVNDLLARKKLRPSGRRNRALLEWIECHRHEFGAPTTAEHPEKTSQGWGDLETQVFQWVLNSCEPADCWSAVKLYAELNHGIAPPLHGPAFGSRAGRALLLRVATANDALEGDRLRALTLLGQPLTLWTGSLPRLPQMQFVDAREQEDLLDRLTPLLASPSAPLRAAAAQTIRRASQPEVLADKHPKSQRALPALLKAYRAEPPSAARDELAEAICLVVGAKHWQEISGNPPGVVALLRDFERRDQQIHFWLSLRPGGRVVYECPMLLLERLESNKVVETKRMPLPVANLPKPWGEGWDGGSALLAEFSLKDFKPGNWRVSVQGAAGKDKDKQKWSAEPKTFLIAAPPKKNNGRPSYLDKAKQ